MKKSAIRTLAGICFVLLASCSERGSGGGGDQAATEPPPAEPPLAREAATPFVDVTAASNMAFKVGYTRPAMARERRAVTESTFGGAAAGDCDGDGDVDLLITYGNTGADNGGGPNRLYLNQLAEQGNGLLFEDIAEEAGVANTRPDGRNDRHSGPTFADMDGDGDLDLFLGGIHDDPSKIYANDGTCHFTDVTANSPDIENMRASHTLSAGFGDYDLDGDLDMFLSHWATTDLIYMGREGMRAHETDHLWRNESDESGIRFVNVSEESGISDLTWQTRAFDFHTWLQDTDFTFTGTFARINDDFWPDIAIAADFGTTQLALNLGDGTFGSLGNPILRDAQFGMGSALGDIDNDGDLDWFISSIYGPGDDSIDLLPWGNRLFINDGSGSRFVDATERYGVADGAWGWAACFLDIDNDADLDIYHTNGWSEPFIGHQVWQTARARAFVMNSAGTYDERAAALGFTEVSSERGIVCADFDHDGDTDIFEMTAGGANSARLWENRTAAAGNNFLRVELEGLPPNTEAAGARIYVTVRGTRQMREIMIGGNYTSQNPTVQIFGLGSAATVDEILVEWPPLDRGDGPRQLGSRLAGPLPASQPGQTLVLRHPELPPQ